MCRLAFGQCFGLILDTTLQKPKNIQKITENRIETLHWFVFLLPLFFRQMVEKLLVLFGSHCNIPACTQHYELEFSIATKFNTLISNLNSYVLFEKFSKTISFVSSNPHFYRFSVANYFFGRYFKCSKTFHNLCQKCKIFLKR